MRVATRLLLPAFCLLVFAGCEPDQKLIIVMPEGWKAVPKLPPNIDQAAMSPLEGPDDWFQENISVGVEKVPLWTSLPMYVTAVKENLKKQADLHDVAVASEGDQVINGNSAHWILLNHNLRVGAESRPVRTLTYMFVKGSKAHIITCSATAESLKRFRPQFEEAVGTVRFEPIKSGS